MSPYEIVMACQRLRQWGEVTVERLSFSVTPEEWEACRKYVQILEPMTAADMPKHEPVTKLVILGVRLMQENIP